MIERLPKVVTGRASDLQFFHSQSRTRDRMNAVSLRHGQAGFRRGDGRTSALAAAGLVWREPARPALAAQPRSLCHLGFGDHAAADARGRGRGALQGIHGALSHAGFAGPGAGTGCAGAVERAGLLPARAHAAQGRAVCGQPPRRQPARHCRRASRCCRASALIRRPPSPASRTARAVAVVDGNVERVLCRLAGWEEAGRGRSRAAAQGRGSGRRTARSRAVPATSTRR